ncbi:hypothetical protein [Chryseobacterium mucoviscidosis]|uniref:hypothetical protein n=1 Tax=Chryseobacterium mucoviscidosis TaxID=1945581 RepID=UPI0031E25BB2
MLKFILMLLGLAFGQNNAKGTNNSSDNGQSTTQLADPATGTDLGDTGGETGQTPPPPKK